jgi:hypothetical protein
VGVRPAGLMPSDLASSAADHASKSRRLREVFAAKLSLGTYRVAGDSIPEEAGHRRKDSDAYARSVCGQKVLQQDGVARSVSNT